MPDNANRKKRIRVLIILIIILHKLAQAIKDDDTAAITAWTKVFELTMSTIQMYALVPEDEWLTAHTDAHAAVVAFCVENEGGELPEYGDLDTQITNWDAAIKAL